MHVSCLCAAQGWPNIFEPLECTQEAADKLTCHSISDFMGVFWHCCQTQVPKSSPKILKLYKDEDFAHASTAIWLGSSKTCYFGKLYDGCRLHITNSFQGGDSGPQKWLHTPYHYQKVSCRWVEETSLNPLAADKRIWLDSAAQVHTSYDLSKQVHGLGAEQINAWIPIKLWKS